MRQTMFIAALLLALGVSPLYAQRRGVSSSHISGSVAAHSGAVARPGGAVRVNPGVRSVGRGTVGVGRNRIIYYDGRFHHHRGFFFSSYPYYNYPYYSYPYYTLYPYYGYGLQSDLIYSNASVQPAYMGDHDTGLQNEVGELRAELQQLREQQAYQAGQESERQQYALNTPSEMPHPLASPPRSSSPQRQQAQAPQTLLIFRDGRKQEVSNYAIVGQTLWIFSEERARKVPLADLDLDATQKANEDRGIDFAIHSKPSS